MLITAFISYLSTHGISIHPLEDSIHDSYTPYSVLIARMQHSLYVPDFSDCSSTHADRNPSVGDSPFFIWSLTPHGIQAVSVSTVRSTASLYMYRIVDQQTLYVVFPEPWKF